MPSDGRETERARPHPGHTEAPRWLDDERNVDRIVYALYAVCALLILVDPFIHKHGPFAIERLWGFYGLFGWVGCVFLVLAAKQLRKLVMRSEDYYDR